MEQKKAKIAIVFEDKEHSINHYNLLLQTFSLPNVLELFTPIILTPRSFLLNQKKGNNHLNLKVIKGLTEAKEGSINIYAYSFEQEQNIFDAFSRIELYKFLFLEFQNDTFDAVISLPCSIEKGSVSDAWKEIKKEDTNQLFHIYNSIFLRVSVQDNTLQNQEQGTTELINSFIEQNKILYKTLQSYFFITEPRIAIISDNESYIVTAIEKMIKEHNTYVFGPFSLKTLEADENEKCFDVLAVYADENKPQLMQYLLQEKSIKLTFGLPFVHAEPTSFIENPIPNMQENEAIILQSIYTAIDLAKNKKQYVLPFHNPLRKNYIDKKREK